MNIPKYFIFFIYMLLIVPCAVADVYVQSYSTGNDGTQYSETLYNTTSNKDKEDELKVKEEELKIKELELMIKEQEQQNKLLYPNRIIYQQIYTPYRFPYTSFGYNRGGLSINYNSHNNNNYQNKPPHPKHPPEKPKDRKKDFEHFEKRVY